MTIHTDLQDESSWPANRASRSTIVAQFGEARAALMEAALNSGDPLADAVVDEMHQLGMAKSRALLDQGMREGLGSLLDPPPALAALLSETETLPGYVDDHLLDELSLPYFSSPLPVHMVSLSAGALIRVYESPSIAGVLTTTGRLVDGAPRRIEETGKWLMQVMYPGSLRVGEPGYVATLQVRMLHAHMRRLARDRGFDATSHGVPINQVDLGRTWMDFTLTAYGAEEAFGFGLTSLETMGLYKYWWYIGHLLGIDARLIHGIADNQAASRLDEVFQAVTGPLIPGSALLAEATLSSVSGTLKELLRVPERMSRPVLNAITRRIHGDAVCQDLQVTSEPAADMWLTPVIAGLRLSRERRRAKPDSWRAEIDKNLQEAAELLAEDATPTAFQRGATGTTD